MKYTVDDVVIMRTPIQCIGKYDLINDLEKGNISITDILSQNPQFEEAVAVSSLDLIYNIIDKKIDKKQEEAIINYFIRSVVRSTPYGLFSGIGNCKFGANTDVMRTGEGGSAQKYCKVDMEWFYALIERFEKDANILSNVNVIFNKQCYVCGERIINPYLSNYGQSSSASEGKNINKSRILYTNQVKYVRQQAFEWISYKKLLKNILLNNIGVPQEVIEKFLLQLIENEYLLTDLRIPLSSADPLARLVEKMKDYQLDDKNRKLYNAIVDINNLRNNYNRLEIGRGISNYIELCNKMKDIHRSKNYLSVITSIGLDNKSISDKVKDKLIKFSKFLVVFSTQDNESAPLIEYKKRFIEKYGAYMEVPILELFDQTLGLGDPYSSTNPLNQSYLSTKKEMIKKYMYDKILFSLKNGEKKVVLRGDDIRFFESLNDKSKNLRYSNTFELNVKILAQDNASIDNGNFKIALAPNAGSNMAGKLLNRFYSSLDEQSRNSLRSIYELNINNSPYVMVDTSYLPKAGRINNICSGNRNYKYSLDCGLNNEVDKESIAMDDILVGYNSEIDRLYIKSQKLNKLIKVFSDSMLNRLVDNHIIRFIWDVSYAYEVHPLENLLSIENYDLKYIPQIEYEDVIICQERWKIRKEELGDLKSFETFQKDFNKLSNLWRMQRFVYIVEHDRYLLIDTENLICMNCLYLEVKKNLKNSSFITIQSAGQETDLWLEDSKKNKYFSELVIQFVGDQNNIPNTAFNYNIGHIKTNTQVDKNKSNVSIWDKRRIYQAGDNGWLYFKIYLEDKKCNEFLAKCLLPFIKLLLNEKQISQFFYIRYADPAFHIRLRIQVRNMNNKYDVLDKFSKWFKKATDKGFGNRYVIDTYEREIERYGGIEAIESAERVFYWDSLLALQLMEMKERNTDDFDDDLIAVALIYSILMYYVDDKNIAEECLSVTIAQHEFQDEFRQKRDKYMSAVQNPSEIPIYKSIEGLVYERGKAIEEYYKTIAHLDNKEDLTNTKWDILMSLLHMFCNRMNGDRSWERKILAITRSALHAVNSRERYLKKKEPLRLNA